MERVMPKRLLIDDLLENAVEYADISGDRLIFDKAGLRRLLENAGEEAARLADEECLAQEAAEKIRKGFGVKKGGK